MQLQSLGREGPLEDGVATLSSTLAWRIPRTEEPSAFFVVQLSHPYMTTSWLSIL